MAAIQNNTVGFSLCAMGHIPSWTVALQKNVADGVIWPMDIPKGSNGQNIRLGDYAFGGAYSITKACKNPETAMQYLDFFYSEEGQLIFEFGILGETYEIKDGKPVYSDAFIEKGKQGGNFAFEKQRMGIHTNGSVWILTNQGRGQEFKQQYVGNLSPLLDIASAFNAASVEKFPVILPTTDEEAEFNKIKTDMDTYKNEMLAKFILGTEPISKWDDFLSGLKSLNSDKALQIKQQQYDRYMKN